jgi:hypothetical protein
MVACARIGHDEHVRGVDRLPAADRRAVEAAAFVEQSLAQLSHRDREVLPRPEEIHELQVDARRLVLFGELDHVLCRHAAKPPSPKRMVPPCTGVRLLGGDGWCDGE